jgi:ankyrin repeat protein
MAYQYNTPLVLVLERQDPSPSLDEIRAFVENDPHFVSRFKYIQLDEMFACTPLELAVNNRQIGAEVVEYIAGRWPGSIREKNYMNRDLPIHVACHRGCSLAVLKTLVKLYPEGVSQEGSAGTLPLHKLFWSDCVSLEAIRFLVEEYPNAIHHRGRLGFLPIHYALQRSNISLEIIQYLVEAFPQSLSMRPKTQHGSNNDTDGAVPIHIACAYQAPLDVIQYLIDQCPNSLKMMNKRGKIPLEVACTGKRNQSQTQVLDLLIKNTPFNLVNPKDLLLANMNVFVNIQIIHYLLVRFPKLAATHSQRGELPLHVCCRHLLGESNDEAMLDAIINIYPTALFTLSKFGRSPLEELNRNPNCSSAIRATFWRRMREMLSSVFNNILSVDACDHVLAFLM